MPETIIKKRIQIHLLPLGSIFLWLLMCTPIGWAKTGNTCVRESVCVEVKASASEVALYALNKNTVPVAVTFAMRTRNLEEQIYRKSLQTLQANERKLIARYSIRNLNRAPRLDYWYDWAAGDTAARHNDSYLYRLPYAAGKNVRVLQGFHSGFSHTGLEQYAVDFKLPEGTDVYAARGGIVAAVEASNDRGCWDLECGNYANYIVIVHADGTTGEYYHLQHNGVLVEPGQRIGRGQLIGRSGNTGHTTTPHLHFAVYRPRRWGETESVAIKFDSVNGVISRPRSGARYMAGCSTCKNDSQDSSQ